MKRLPDPPPFEPDPLNEQRKERSEKKMQDHLANPEFIRILEHEYEWIEIAIAQWSNRPEDLPAALEHGRKMKMERMLRG